MKRFGLASGIGLVLIVNAIVFTGVLYNRSGEPDAEVTLTEREASLIRTTKDNSGVFLKLNWEMSGAYQFEEYKNLPNWLAEAKLRELGLDNIEPPQTLDSAKYYQYYRKFPSIKVFIVLEFDGKSWQGWLKNHQKDLESVKKKIFAAKDKEKKKSLEKVLKQRERLHLVKSRLFAIDAGNDPMLLRNTYSDTSKYIITSGVIKVNYTPRYSGKINSPARVQGRIHRLFPVEIFVPNSYRTFLGTLKSSRNYSYYYVPENKSDLEILPQYEVTLKFGKKYEAWISDVMPLNQKL